jgi:predicted SAM-dependent methyltransferase
MDLMRLRARGSRQRVLTTDLPTKLHLGCGKRKVEGWLNVDINNGDQVVDLASEVLPWPDNHFQFIVSQHVIEHLELESELLPLFQELYRVAAQGCEVWLSCPDLAKICQSYSIDKGKGLIEDRKSRPHIDIKMDGLPSQHMINRLFHQSGEHKNLFDFELLDWALSKTGFTDCEQVVERDLLSQFPEFPCRNDDCVSLYVRALR